jgi:long-subunit acyl-CoA synthetase (AMP-forming)
MSTQISTPSKFTYGYWRTDKEKEPGFSHELISCDSAAILDKTDLDTLEVDPYPGVNTLFKAMERNLKRIPDHPWLGTRVGDLYEWMTWKESMDIAQNLSYGIMDLGLCPEVDAEGRKFRFMGIQAKNRKEWVLTHCADIHQSITTVALYDTLGAEATLFVLN